MPIEALPPATVRAIGSTSVISDPCSVVKELIDNALDASASSVVVEIAQDTVDVIQVKDNGHGIAVDDHASVCKHAFTSKICSIDDLKNVGGTSLGFRGEALASIAEMSGSVSITTRLASDMVASTLEYGRDGELSRTQKTSHPIGTSVRIRGFLKYIPVRKQAALKGASKCLIKVKKLVQAYAMAQPSKRFSLKVLKAKNENNNWSFVPGPDFNLVTAAVKIVGRDVASCCVTKESATKANSSNDDSSVQQTYSVSALLPKSDADLTQVNNKGQFLSVDGRPLSTTRGTGHEIVKLFKSHLRASHPKEETSRSISDPFLCLQLKCPLGSYDVNIEPGKDDVLFEDKALLFNLIEGLFIDQYGALPESASKNSVKKTVSSKVSESNANFDLLMARRSPEPTQIRSNEEIATVEFPLLASPSSQRPARFLMASSPKQTAHNSGQGSEIDIHQVSGAEGSRLITPWSISRINASSYAPRRDDGPLLVQSTASIGEKGGRIRNRPPRSQSPPNLITELISPSQSRLTPVSPLNSRRRPGTSQESPDQPNSFITASRRAARERDRERYGNRSLDTWFQRTTQPLLGSSSSEPLVELDDSEPSLSQLAEQRFILSSNRPSVSSSLNDTSRVFRENLRRGNTPDPSPRQVDRVVSPVNEAARPLDSGRGFPILENWAASIHEGFTPSTSLELERALDFERRKREANRRTRTRSGTRNGTIDIQASDFSHCDQNNPAEAASTAKRNQIEQPTVLALAEDDPRAYLMSLERDRLSNHHVDNIGTVRRTRTSRLPLERIPDGHDLHNISLCLRTNTADILQLYNTTASEDRYTQGYDEFDPFLSSDLAALTPSWNERLVAIISKNYKTKNASQDPTLFVDLNTAIMNHEKNLQAVEIQPA